MPRFLLQPAVLLVMLSAALVVLVAAVLLVLLVAAPRDPTIPCITPTADLPAGVFALPRDEVLARARGPGFRSRVNRVDRKEAKLMTLAEWEQTRGVRTPGADGQLVWVVGFWGDLWGEPSLDRPWRGGWGFQYFDARTGVERGGGVARDPIDWDALPDHAAGPC